MPHILLTSIYPVRGGPRHTHRRPRSAPVTSVRSLAHDCHIVANRWDAQDRMCRGRGERRTAYKVNQRSSTLGSDSGTPICLAMTCLPKCLYISSAALAALRMSAQTANTATPLRSDWGSNGTAALHLCPCLCLCVCWTQQAEIVSLVHQPRRTQLDRIMAPRAKNLGKAALMVVVPVTLGRIDAADVDDNVCCVHLP